MSSFLANLTWRRAVKRFRTGGEKVDVNPVMEAIFNAPTCYGIQPYKIMVIEDPALRAQLLPVSYGQPQVVECDYLIVFMAYRNPLERVGEWAGHINASDELVGMVTGYLSQFEDMSWSARQAYIALGFGLAACAEKRIASCPMEGFNPIEYKRILNIPENLMPVCLLAIGTEVPGSNPYPRWRFPPSELLMTPPSI